MMITIGRSLTLAIAAAGAAAFHVLGLPLPFLLGPMFACLVAALVGAPLEGFGVASVAMRTVLGVAVGASITPALIGRLGDFAVSAALVPVFVLMVGALGYPYFRRLCGFDPKTAYYAAMPGGLQDMIAFGEEAGADPRALSLVHATRVLVIVSIMPFALSGLWGLSLDNAPGLPAADIPPVELALMLACALVGWRGGLRIGLFGAAILGPMAVTAAASLTDLIHHRPPSEAIVAAQFFIGTGVGVYYVGVTGAELRRVVLAALGYCVMLASLSVAFAEAVALTGTAPLVEAVLGFAPGGQAEMVVLAIVAGADIAYVVTLHLTRLIVVILGAPIAARLLR
ncbi:MAG: AbrB family transcriptional regulator [Pseudomonadota bacterium]